MTFLSRGTRNRLLIATGSLAAGFRLEYASGIGVEGTYANFRVSCQNLQADDQSPFTR